MGREWYVKIVLGINGRINEMSWIRNLRKRRSDSLVRTKTQVSDSFQLGIVLALAGGFMDAYSYIGRGQVFANAQTGNLLLMGVNLAEGNWLSALRYVLPVMSFSIGIAIADVVRLRKTGQKRLHWRQIALLIEIGVFGLVSVMPQGLNLVANSLTSLGCGIQVQSFRKIEGNGMATTMCIGNLRSATSAVVEYWHTKERKLGVKGILYLGIILFFVLGAVFGNVCVKWMGEKAILGCMGLLGIGVLMMFGGEK